MKKLLIISTNTVHVLNYINLINSYFNDILFITDVKNDQLKYGNLRTIYTEFSIKKPLLFYKSIGIIRKAIKEFNPTIIHSHQITTNSLLTMLANKEIQKPILFTAWGSDILFTPSQGYLYRTMVRYILQNAEYFTSDSKYMGEVMSHIAGKPLNILIANFGINITESLKDEKQNIIYSNRQLMSFYRIDKIIKAFGKFVGKSNLDKWKLVIGAEGDEKEKLVALSDSLKISEYIEFVGWLEKEQNSYYYNIAKYYISIPESDATSISLLEAMAAGCIPILSDLPANREWVEDGVNGVIVSDLESNFIVKALEIDILKAQSINKQIIKKDGTKEANRLKFISFYEQIISA